MNAERTQKYGFETPTEDDFYDIEVHNRNIRKTEEELSKISSAYVIPEGTDIPVKDRVEGKMYFKVSSRQITGGTSEAIKVSPTMGLKIQ